MEITVAGFPRSGNTWLLYCCGVLTGCTKNNTEIALDTNLEICKRHIIAIKEDDILLFVLRNHREAISSNIRHFGQSGLQPILELTKPYMILLKEFDNALTNNKILIRYEDMIQSPQTFIQQISTFLEPYGSTQQRCDDFIANLATHQQTSYKNYGETFSGDDVLYYSKLLGTTDCDAINQYARELDSAMYDKYLASY